MGCEKLPNLIELDDFGGDYGEYEDAVYNEYKRTFENHEFEWDGKRIAHKKYPMFKGKPGTFWHIVSSGENEEERLPDLRRYERVAWPAHILDYCKKNCDKLLIWKNERRGKHRILIWCTDIDYVVVLDERDTYCVFWTAYPVTYKHAKVKMMKEYQEYIKQKALE